MRIINGISIGSITFDDKNYIISEVSGLEMPTTRLPRYNQPGASGAFISNALYGERKVQIKGWVNAPDGKRTTYLANRTNLINALIYTYDINGTPQPLTVTITLETGLVVTFQAFPSENMPLQMGFTPDQVDYEDFLLTLIAPGYTLASQTSISAVLSLPIGGGTAIPTPIPISLGASSGGSAVINNTGSVPAFPVITLTPPLTNPFIANNTQGGFLSLTLNLQVGQQNVVIDCNAQTITQGANDLTGIQSQSSSFWSVNPGNNTISFNAAGGSGAATITIFPQFLGI